MIDLSIPIRLQEVSLFFNNRAALDDLSLDIHQGKVTFFVGGSGSGKSLVLKCAAGLIYPDKGRVSFEGRTISSMGDIQYRKMQSRTGFHFQDAALWANKSLEENLSLPLLTANPDISDKDLKDKVADSFASVGLNLDPSLRPASISMGQQKLVSFLRATINHPEILFLDDPLGHTDFAGSRQLISRIEEFKDAGVTIIISAHDKDLIRDMADIIAVLSDGQLTNYGPSQDLFPLLQELV